MKFSALETFQFSNGDISVKVVTESDAWDTFITSNGVFVEYIHDYGIIELDDSYKNDKKKLIKDRFK